MLVIMFQLACQVRRVKRQFFCHQFIFRSKRKYAHFKHPKLFQRRALLPVALKCFQIKDQAVYFFLIEQLLQHAEPFA